MSLSREQIKDVRAAIYVVDSQSGHGIGVLQRLSDLDSALQDGSWGLWYDFEIVKMLQSDPECEPYKPAVTAFLNIVTGVSVPPPAVVASPEPEPHEDSYETDPKWSEFESSVLKVLRDHGYKPT